MPKDLLLVDDEAGIRKVLGISLTDRGYRVHTADSGPAALQLFSEFHPAIVLTDIKMPGMDGLELLRELKRRNADTEVIMLTGHGDMELAVKSLKYEATDYIVKPIDDDVLDVALRRAADRITMRNRLRDYTENLERMVEEKTRRLIQAERLAVIGETVAGLAHAIKNIAGGLKGGAFVVEKGLALGNDQYLQEGWQMTRANVERIEQLSLDLLNIASPSRPDFKRADPNQPLKDVFELMDSRCEQSNIRLTLHVDPNLSPIDMHPEGIYRCLLNLVTNALDACLENRSLSQSQPTDATIELRSESVEDGVEYSVRDCCGGMAEDVQAKLFQGFFTTKGSRGTGIGLMLTRKIIDAHHGRIQVTVEKGLGCTFVIWLPASQPEKRVDDATPS